ncbi:MAG: methyltransferase domain-containing protein [Lachnospiraceae bacterium]|nr:methyltransferase domain-containing protein [Lachnospiraceae bacterium]
MGNSGEDRAKHRSCPVCACNDRKVMKTIVMKVSEDYHLPESYDVVVCGKCGLVYADTEASMEDYDWYYTHCNFYGDDSKDDHFQRFKVVEVFLDKYVSREAVLLEIGAGNGRFEMELKEHGYVHITGTDPSEESVRRLRENGIASYVANIYSEVPIEENEKYDGIFLFEVAEHLLIPGKGIENVSKMLKKDGIFMISVPDYSQIGNDPSSIPNYFNLEHINYFSEKTLDYLLALNGLERIAQMRAGVDLTQVYRKTEKVRFPDKDTATEQAICSYFEKQNEREMQTKELIKELKIQGEELVIWGTGSYVMSLLATTDLLQCKIKAFVDNNKIQQGRKIYNCTVYPPAYLKDKEYTVLICSVLNGNVIKKQLEAMNTKNNIIIL